MANLTANTFFRGHGRGLMPNATERYILTNAVTVYVGSLLMVDANGLLIKPSDVATNRFIGVSVEQKVGDGTSFIGVNTEGLTLEQVTVTGVSSQAAVGDAVYIATTDNPNDLQVAATTNTKPVGYITRWYSGTICDVRLMSPAEYAASL